MPVGAMTDKLQDALFANGFVIAGRVLAEPFRAKGGNRPVACQSFLPPIQDRWRGKKRNSSGDNSTKEENRPASATTK